MNPNEPIRDARTLGVPKMLILGLQHMFAMFGATIVVPIIVQGYGLPLSIQTTLFFAGIGTLFFHLCSKFKVPAFLGSSFAFLGGFYTVANLPSYEGMAPEAKLASPAPSSSASACPWPPPPYPAPPPAGLWRSSLWPLL